MPSHIVNVEAIPIVTDDVSADDLDGSYETVLVRVTDEDGRVGNGETDAPTDVIKAYIEASDAHDWSRGPKGLLIGKDPFEIPALYDELYLATRFPGRRGIGIHALSAIDIALHDLVGKQLGRPAYQLLGGARHAHLHPYGTIWPGLPNGRPISALMDEIKRQMTLLVESGLNAVKMEVLFGDLVTDSELVELIGEGRAHLGDDVTLGVDFGYRWTDWRSALSVLERIQEFDIYFAEAPLDHDNLISHRRLVERSPIRVGGAEMSATRFECQEWLDATGVDLIQASVNRCGGLTEAHRIAEIAARYGATMIPHGYKTGITVAASMHFQASTPNAPFFEFLSPATARSKLRLGLVGPEPKVHDGVIDLPTAPGLGFEVDEDVVERYRVDQA
jgi:L-alanine-DL-glutamate epimerase-like enolase superfamily enzyme